MSPVTGATILQVNLPSYTAQATEVPKLQYTEAQRGEALKMLDGLRLNDSGPQVAALKTKLAETKDSSGKPYLAAEHATGDKYTPETKAAVERFQSDRSLQKDGVVGQQTYSALHFNTGAEVPVGFTQLRSATPRQDGFDQAKFKERLPQPPAATVQKDGPLFKSTDPGLRQTFNPNKGEDVAMTKPMSGDGVLGGSGTWVSRAYEFLTGDTSSDNSARTSTNVKARAIEVALAGTDSAKSREEAQSLSASSMGGQSYINDDPESGLSATARAAVGSHLLSLKPNEMTKKEIEAYLGYETESLEVARADLGSMASEIGTDILDGAREQAVDSTIGTMREKSGRLAKAVEGGDWQTAQTLQTELAGHKQYAEGLIEGNSDLKASYQPDLERIWSRVSDLNKEYQPKARAKS